MNRRLWFLACCFGLLSALPALSQTPAKSPAGTRDPEVAKGIAQVDEGDYEGAILTLDAAARRLANGKADQADLSQAYVHLGIAYLAKGHESAAKAKFRAAIEQIRDLSLSPDKYPPKVIDAFEAAKNEGKAAQLASPAPSTAKKGGGKGLLIAGGVAVVGGGVALAAGGGGGSSSSSTPSSTLPPTTGSRLDFSGYLPTSGGATYVGYTAVPTQPGTLEARVTWTNGQAELGIGCQEQNPPYTDCGGTYQRTSNTTGVYRVAVTQKPYFVSVYYYGNTVESYTFTILFP